MDDKDKEQQKQPQPQPVQPATGQPAHGGTPQNAHNPQNEPPQQGNVTREADTSTITR
jgi:hypothetical protein